MFVLQVWIRFRPLRGNGKWRWVKDAAGARKVFRMTSSCDIVSSMERKGMEVEVIHVTLSGMKDEATIPPESEQDQSEPHVLPEAGPS